MRRFGNMFLWAIIAALVFTTGCKKDSDVEEGLLLRTYMEENSMDLGNIIGSKDDGTFFVMGATAESDVDGKYIIDLRSATDYAAGHIDGAVNVAFSDLLTAADQATAPILVVCYTGQTACYATTLLRLYGKTDAKALKWGMSGWNATFDKWTAGTGNVADGHANWTTDAAPSLDEYDYPTLATGESEGAAILQKRIEEVVASGFKGESASAVIDNPDNYYINNFFSEAHYTGFGHIDGAVRINPLNISLMSNLDASKTVVTYCYTGQTSAIITAYLNVLGYDAKSLKFGMNGLYNSHDLWTSGPVPNNWGGDSNPKDFSTVQ